MKKNKKTKIALKVYYFVLLVIVAVVLIFREEIRAYMLRNVVKPPYPTIATPVDNS